MTGVHDLGGSSGAGPIDKSQHETEDWERLADAVTVALDKKGLKTTDEHRRAIESLDPSGTKSSATTSVGSPRPSYSSSKKASSPARR